MRVLILGVTGQDGSYLAEQLVAAGDEVWGMTHRPIHMPHINLVEGDLADLFSLERVFDEVQPDEIYNLAAATSPGGAWGVDQDLPLANITGIGVIRILEMMRLYAPQARLVHASSSAIYDPHRYGLYGISKQFSHHAVQGYRNGYGMHVSNATLFSHTSSRQDGRFLAPTITRTLGRIKNGSPEKLKVVDLNSRRDWGYAPDFMRAFPLIARAQEPGDYDVATGSTHSAFEFIYQALTVAGLGWDAVTQLHGKFAPVEAAANIGPLESLGWKQETSFDQMVEIMMRADM